MDFMHESGFHAPVTNEEAAESPQGRTTAETELEFLTRRAMEESRLSKQAPTAKAAAAHAYLAAAYSAQVSKELARQAELEALLLQIH